MSRYDWSVTFVNPGGLHDLLSANSAFTNPDATITTTSVTSGGMYLVPVPGDFLRRAESKPQVGSY